MNVKEFLEEQIVLGNAIDKKIYTPSTWIQSEVATEFVKRQILSLDEFKNVKTLNFLETPVFFSDEFENPIDKNNTTYVGGERKFQETHTIQLGENIELNEIVDLYTIQLGFPVYKEETINTLKTGVWMLPQRNTMDNEKTIVIKYNKDIELIGGFNFDKLVENVTNAVKETMIKNTPNVDSMYPVHLRVSGRSIKQKTYEESSSSYTL